MSVLRLLNNHRNQSEATKFLLDWPNGISSALVRLTRVIQ